MSVPIKTWTGEMAIEPQAMQQLYNIAALPVVAPHVAVMPDVHLGKGATVGSVIPTVRAIIPAAVGVDLGCGMIAVETSLTPDDLTGKLPKIRAVIEDAVPVGGPGVHGSWLQRGFGGIPQAVGEAWGAVLKPGLASILQKHPKIGEKPNVEQFGTLGTGNHFIEVCESSTGFVWLMLHSGSRGVGNRIATYFIERAKEAAARRHDDLPDRDLAWLAEEDPAFADYVEAVGWAQNYAKMNRRLMLNQVVGLLHKVMAPKPVLLGSYFVQCHHNYVQKETHFGQEVYLTRKGAVDAGRGVLGIIPGSMGAKSFIVRGKGNADSFNSCSHGAGRRMSRGQAKRTITVEEHLAATEGVECRKDQGVLDESPAAYKSIDDVMKAQADLVEVVATLKGVVCVKG